MFQWRREGQGDLGGPDANMIVVRGRTLQDRIRMLFAASTIGAHDEVAKKAADGIAQLCGQDRWCRVQRTFQLLRMMAAYDGDEGRRFKGDSEFDVFRTFKHLARTGLADCDCYTASLCTLLWLQGVPCAARAIEQWNPDEGKYQFNHVYGLAKLDAGEVVPLELTPVPPNRMLVGPGWETPRDTYRNKADFWYDGSTWHNWVSRVDLSSPTKIGSLFLSTAPAVHAMST
jgi:hypothetical protein